MSKAVKKAAVKKAAPKKAAVKKAAAKKKAPKVPPVSGQCNTPEQAAGAEGLPSIMDLYKD